MGSSSFFNDPTDYTVVDDGGDGSGFYDGPAYTAIDPVAINNSVAEAAASATAAEGSATASAASAAASAVSAAAALVSEGSADTSEANAASSASNAATSETNAAGSATTATTQAGIATTKASEAATSAAAALVSEGNADTSETNAAASASAASTSEANASTSETNAAASASSAATSASNAATAVQAAAGTATPLVDGTAAVGAGTKWAREDHVHPTDTSRAPLASPALTGTPTAPTASVGTNTTQLATTEFVIANAASGRAPFAALADTGIQFNGAMEISQELGSTARTTAGFVVDGWSIATSGAQTFSAAQVADAPTGLTNSIKVTITGANATPGAGDYLYLNQKIEGFRSSRLAFGTASALSVSICFWTKLHRTGTYSGSVRNSATNRSYPFSFTQSAADTWEFKTVTVPGDITGTWIGATNGIGLQVSFTIGSGTTSLGTASTWAASNYTGVTGSTNGMAATTDTYQITGVVILPGSELPTAADSILLARPYHVEVDLAQRYYQKSYPASTAIGTAATFSGLRTIVTTSTVANNTVYGQTMNFLKRMRTAPTVTVYGYQGGSGKVSDSGGVDLAASSGAASAIGEDCFRVQNNSGGTVTTGSLAQFHYVADARL